MAKIGKKNEEVKWKELPTRLIADVLKSYKKNFFILNGQSTNGVFAQSAAIRIYCKSIYYLFRHFKKLVH